MEVTTDNFEDVFLPVFKEQIRSCAFVAIDAEYTALRTKPEQRTRSVQSYLDEYHDFCILGFFLIAACSMAPLTTTGASAPWQRTQSSTRWVWPSSISIPPITPTPSKTTTYTSSPTHSAPWIRVSFAHPRRSNFSAKTTLISTR